MWGSTAHISYTLWLSLETCSTLESFPTLRIWGFIGRNSDSLSPHIRSQGADSHKSQKESSVKKLCCPKSIFLARTADRSLVFSDRNGREPCVPCAGILSTSRGSRAGGWPTPSCTGGLVRFPVVQSPDLTICLSRRVYELLNIP